MSDISKHIKNISWRFTGKKSFTPTKEDIVSLNEIIKWINNEKETRMHVNHHFGKIVSWVFLNLLRHNGGDKTFVENEIVKIFEMPLPEHYEAIRLQIEAFKDREAFDVLGITDPYQIEKREDGYRHIDDVRVKHLENKDLIKEHEELLLQAIKPIEFKYVADNMQYFITELLNRYANKK